MDDDEDWEQYINEEGVDYEHLQLPDTCSKDPRAIHGFDRNGSHCENRYVCLCESQRFDKE